MEQKGLKLLSMANQMNVSDMATTIITGIVDGTVNAPLIGVVLKKFAKLQEEVNNNEEAKKAIFNETCKFQEGNKKTIALYGAKITVGSVRTWWEYQECNDPLWNALDYIEKELKLYKKQREEELQATVPKVTEMFGMPTKSMIIERLPKLVWEENGEIVTITPPVKKSMDGLKYSV